jgi:anti-sigma factor RsiW
MNVPSDCKVVLVDIAAYLDGDLAGTACDAIERHCQVCPSCEALVKGLRETVGLCRQAGAAPLPDAVRQRARDGVRRLLDRDSQKG